MPRRVTLSPRRSPIWVAFGLSLAGTHLAAQEIAAIEGALSLHKVDPVLGQSTPAGTIALASPQEHRITALARSNHGALYGISTAQASPSVVTADVSRIYAIDPDTGTATPLATVGSVIAVAATVHPVDGSLWVLHAAGPLTPFGAHLQLLRIDPATWQVTPLGELPLFSGPFSGLAFDAFGSLYTVKIGDSTLWRIDPTNPGGPTTAAIGGLGFTVGFDVRLARRDDGSILAYHPASGVFRTLDTGTGLATAIGVLANPTLGPIAAGGCGGQGATYGTGCLGSGGFVPKLEITGCIDPGSQVTVRITQALGGSTALVFLAAGQASLPIGAGCTLLLSPPFPPAVALPLSGVGFGNGTLTIPALVPPGLTGVTVYMQAFTLDSAVSIGAAGSNGLKIAIP